MTLHYKIIPIAGSCLISLAIMLMPVTSAAVDSFPAYSSYFGGTGDDRAYAMATDADGNVYITGQTSSPDLPFVVDQTSLSGTDAFVTKISPVGDVLFSRYIGAASTLWLDEQEMGRAIAVSPDGGAIYVAGSLAGSVLFAGTEGAYDDCDNGHVDAFFAVLDGADGRLRYLSCFGGAAADHVTDLLLNSDGSVTLVGYTSSKDFLPETELSAFQSSKGDLYDIPDAFVVRFARLEALGRGDSDLLFASYLGGNGADKATALAGDDQGNLYITGTTNSTDLSTVLADEPSGTGRLDIFVAKLMPDGGAYSQAYVRLPIADDSCAMAPAIALNDSGPRPVVAYRAAAGMLVMAVDPVTGAAAQPAAVLLDDELACGVADNHAIDIILDDSGGGLVAATSRALGSGREDMDGVVVRFDADLKRLYLRYLGGTADDALSALSRTADGVLQVAGVTGSGNYPVTDDSQLAGGVDVLRAGFKADVDLAVTVSDQGPALYNEPLQFDIVLRNNGPEPVAEAVFELSVAEDFLGDVAIVAGDCALLLALRCSPGAVAGELAAGAEVRLGVELSSQRVGEWSFGYRLTGSGHDLVPANQSGSFVIKLVTKAELPAQLLVTDATNGATGGGSGGLTWAPLAGLLVFLGFILVRRRKNKVSN